MYTHLSWYLTGTSKATHQGFLRTVEKWLTSSSRKSGYDFHFKAPLEDIYPNSDSFSGNNCTLEIVCADDDTHSNTSILLKNERGNTVWIVEAVFRSKIDDTNTSYFVINYRKKIIDPNKPSDFYDGTRTPPRLPELLIEEKLATKEEGEEFLDFPLAPLSKEQQKILSKLKMPYYPIITVNASELNPNYVKGDSIKFLTYYQTISHLIIKNVDEEEKSPEKWAFKIEYPRLKYTAEYYSYQNYPRRANEEKINSVEAQTESNRKRVSRTPLTAFQLQHRPYIVIKDLLALVNEGISFFSEFDHSRISKFYEKNNTIKRVNVTKELAEAIQSARKAKGLTQSELAQIAILEDDEPNSSINSLLISRIEKTRLKRVEISTLDTLEKCLNLPIGYLLSSCADASPQNDNPEQKNEPVINSQIENNSDDALIRFCVHCGREYPSPDVNFCPYCGTKKIHD